MFLTLNPVNELTDIDVPLSDECKTFRERRPVTFAIALGAPPPGDLVQWTNPGFFAF